MRTISKREFDIFNESILYNRLMHVSYMLLITYPCFFIVDFFFYKDMDLPIYKEVLTAVHLTGFVSSIVFLLIKRFKPNQFRNGIIHSYVLLYIAMGAVSSINSQFLNGNIYVYIIILLGAAIVFPIRPRNLVFFILGVHLCFTGGLFLVEHDYYSFLSKMINTTGTAVIAFTISLSFYSYQKNDFYNQQKIKRNEESLRRLFDINPNPLFLFATDFNKILLSNKAAGELNAESLFNSSQDKLEIIMDLEKHQSIKNYCIELPNQGKWSLISFEYVNYMDETCILMSATDITELKEKEVALTQHASIDALTGVLNRRSGMALLEGLLSNGQREFILCYLDINNLKVVNDQFGHSMGDDLIKTSCEMINRYLGKSDVLFRLGGDEFVIILFNLDNEDAKGLLLAISNELEQLQLSKQKPYPISASHGLYHYIPGTRISVEEILEQADQEMYRHKFIFKNTNGLASTP